MDAAVEVVVHIGMEVVVVMDMKMVDTKVEKLVAEVVIQEEEVMVDTVEV